MPQSLTDMREMAVTLGASATAPHALRVRQRAVMGGHWRWTTANGRSSNARCLEQFGLVRDSQARTKRVARGRIELPTFRFSGVAGCLFGATSRGVVYENATS
jgi:hypothetical protein